MRQKLQIIALILIFVLPVFLNAFTFLNETQYKNLTKKEKAEYRANLDRQMAEFHQRKNEATMESEELERNNEDIRQRLAGLDVELAALYAELGITEEDINAIHTRIQYYKDQLTNWERMSDDELWTNAKAFRELNEDYRATHDQRLARLPEFQRDFSDLNRRFTAVDNTLDRLRKGRGYYEDNYEVRPGDTLQKISGYDFIYNDPTKWGIIYRANRDTVPRSYALRTGQNLRIPRGLPTEWKVFTGESLWRISQYPEVYGTGTKWPIIYRANRDKIKDPDLIFPNQVFVIPRDDN
jgi:predicted nuclease with TOPRIM domain